MGRRGSALELAILGLLADAPMHGYELRKRVNSVLGRRLLSFGSLYPALKSLSRAGYITAITESSVTQKRPRIVYHLTPEGKEHLGDLLADVGPAAWNDDNFDIRFALFGRTDSPARVRILEGRRSRLEEHVEQLKTSAVRGIERMDSYTRELQQHGLDSAEREIHWLSDLIDKERRAQAEPQHPKDQVRNP